MDRPVREKKRPNDYDPAKEAAKPQWKKPKSEKKNHLLGGACVSTVCVRGRSFSFSSVADT